jgi:hypothetical protein
MTQLEEQIVAKRLRRLYKTKWERAKRKRLRESHFELVELPMPRSLAKRLHAWTPKGVGFTNFLLRVLSAGTGGKPLWESAAAYQRRAAAFNVLQQPLEQTLIGRNSRCPCGSGRKWKQCCAKVARC